MPPLIWLLADYGLILRRTFPNRRVNLLCSANPSNAPMSLYYRHPRVVEIFCISSITSKNSEACCCFIMSLETSHCCSNQTAPAAGTASAVTKWKGY